MIYYYIRKFSIVQRFIYITSCNGGVEGCRIDLPDMVLCMKNMKKEFDTMLKARLNGRETLGLKFNPFKIRSLDQESLIKIFVNRKNEVKNLLGVPELSRNALIYGHYGIGKTALLRYVLYGLTKTSVQNISAIYTTFTGTSEIDFINTIGLAVSDLFKDENNDAKEMYKKIKGTEISKKSEVSTEAGVKFIVQGGGKYARAKEVTDKSTLNPAYIKNTTREILKKMAKKYDGIVIGVDEVDKMNPRDFNKFVANVRDILDFEGSFIFTGSYSFLTLAGNITSTQYGAFDIKVRIPDMSINDLVLLARKYCTFAGNNKCFDKEVLIKLAEQSFGIPRAMVVLCGGAIESATKLGISIINEENLENIVIDIGKVIYDSLTPTQIKVVKYISEKGGELNKVNKEMQNKLGMARTTIYTHLSSLMNKDAVFEKAINGDRVWKLNTGLNAHINRI